MAIIDWSTFLRAFSRDLLGDPAIRSSAPPEVLASGWMGYPGAAEEVITRSEARLGIRFPPSYRAFLRTTNGWRHTGPFIDELYPVEKVRWFREQNRDWIAAYNTGTGRRLPGKEYFVYGKDQDSARFRPEYLKSALEISAIGDSCIYLLNPQVVFADGEWEAWFFANWLPGASRYRSFAEMMEAERQSFLQL
jgi:hypothetical protein